MPESVRVLGIDPGSRFTGYAIIDVVGTNASVVDLVWCVDGWS